MSSNVAAKQPAVRKARPYWHMDMKWIVGLLLVVAVSVTLALTAFESVTNESNGIKILTYAIAGLFSPNGLDDGGDAAEVRKKIAESPDHKFYPIPGAQLAITEADLAKSPRQLRLDLFGQLAGPLYRQDPAEIAQLAPGAELKESLVSSLGVGALFTRPAHDRIVGFIKYPLVAAIVLGLLLIYFSYGWGRLASPGWVLIASAFVPFVITGAFEWGVIRPPAGEVSGGGMAYVASLLAPIIVSAIHPVYARFFWTGVGLVVVAILGAIIWHFVRKPAVVPVDL